MLQRFTLTFAVAAAFWGQAYAQVTNGDFQDGGSGWTIITPLGWTSNFPASGGNPGGYATAASPDRNSAGQSRLSQTFTIPAGAPDSCRIAFDYSVTAIDAADSTARVICSINNEVSYISPSIGQEGIPWTTVVCAAPCGEVTLEISLQVDAGDNAWRVSYDNVMSEIVDPVEATTWGRIKSAYRGLP